MDASGHLSFLPSGVRGGVSHSGVSHGELRRVHALGDDTYEWTLGLHAVYSRTRI